MNGVEALAGNFKDCIRDDGGNAGYRNQGGINDIGVVADPAIQAVDAGAAIEHIIARAAVKAVVTRIAKQRVIQGRGDDAFDTCQHIAQRIARKGAGDEVDAHRAGRGRIVYEVDAKAAVDGVGPRAADQAVIAVAAIQRIVGRAADQAVIQQSAGQDVGIAVAGQRVIEGRAYDIFKVRDHVRRRTAD